MGYSVKDWRPGTGRVKGYFTLVVNDMEINDFSLVDGQNGLFVSFPSRQYTDKRGAKKYSNTVFIPDKDRRQAFNDWAVRELATFMEAVPKADGGDPDDDCPF